MKGTDAVEILDPFRSERDKDLVYVLLVQCPTNFSEDAVVFADVYLLPLSKIRRL